MARTWPVSIVICALAGLGVGPEPTLEVVLARTSDYVTCGRFRQFQVNVTENFLVKN